MRPELLAASLDVANADTSLQLRHGQLEAQVNDWRANPHSEPLPPGEDPNVHGPIRPAVAYTLIALIDAVMAAVAWMNVS